MNPPLVKIINGMASDILNFVYLVVDGSSLKDNLLKESVRVKAEGLKNPVINIFFNGYLSFIDSERSSGFMKNPSVSELRDWALQKGLPADNSTLYLVASGVWKLNQAGRPILSVLEDEIERSFENKWADELLNVITMEIENLYRK